MAKRSDETLLSLPETKAASKAARAELDALLKEAHSLAQLEKRQKEVKARIVELLQEQGLAADGRLGARAGDLCAVATWNQGRKSFDRALAIENGVTPEQIEASMKQGNGYWVCELQKIEGS